MVRLPTTPQSSPRPPTRATNPPLCSPVFIIALRQQTQERLPNATLSKPTREPWVRLTMPTMDFGAVAQGPGLLSARELRNLAVVNKNASRLVRIRDWLVSIPEAVRRGCPALIIDDEADQATPNTKAAIDDLSAINGLIRGSSAVTHWGLHCWIYGHSVRKCLSGSEAGRRALPVRLHHRPASTLWIFRCRRAVRKQHRYGRR